MSSWFQLKVGFSAVGLVFLLCLFVPNILFACQDTAWQQTMPEPVSLLIPERVGQVLVCLLVLSDGRLQWPQALTARVWLMAAAGICMALYLAAWVRYFGSPAESTFYESFLGLPLPLATLPVAAAVLLGIYARSFWLVLAACVFGYGHVGIHIWHAQQR
ncbi:MAG: hypothetical protein HDQ87_04900 [Clostridia bacterium]|nr:hypothetical protein [Clostridia bacterium]